MFPQTISQNNLRSSNSLFSSEQGLDEFETRRKLATDYNYFAANILKIRTKSGELKSLVFNTAQEYIHSKLEEQKARIGRVRALILKGRQQGCSTYVGGRFYHKTTNSKGFRTFILTHEANATANLFGMVQRYYDNTPLDLRPVQGISNQKALDFPMLDSSYRVGTAGKKGVGRSNTIQLFHGSEAAIWPYAAEHAAGILQAVPKIKGTEIILESTANGIGNFFYTLWTEAMRGENDFIPVFVPWFWQEEYAEPVPPGFQIDEKEAEYQALYNLTTQQMVWRRHKISELESEAMFKQEYPGSPEEAFQVTGVESFIDAAPIVRARKNQDKKSFGAIIAGYDPKRDGRDRHGFIYRQGTTAFGLRYLTHNRFGESVAFMKRMLDSDQPFIDRLFLDYGGSGWEIYQMLEDDGYTVCQYTGEKRVELVNFGEAALNPAAYPNRRTEMWGEMRKWFMNPTEPVAIPDNDSLVMEVVAPCATFDAKSRRVIEPKIKTIGRLKYSPDGGDALALTFAKPVRKLHIMDKRRLEARKIEVDGAAAGYDPFKYL